MKSMWYAKNKSDNTSWNPRLEYTLSMGFKVAIQEEWKHENMKDKRKGSDCEVELKKIF